MFKRPHATKTTTPIRSSDLRKLREHVVEQFPRAAAVVKRLVPDGLLVAKATTHLDEHVTVYSAPNGDPRLVRIGKGTDGPLVPTCYAFDLANDLVPQLETAEQVVHHLQSGSALFTAGVSHRSLARLPDDAKPGDLVSIVVYGHPDTVVAVGHLAATKPQLLDAANDDRKGKAVLTLHARGDSLWDSGSKTVPPTTSTPETAAPTTTRDLETSLASTSLASTSTSASASEAHALSPSQVDDILHTALLYSIQLVPPSAYPIVASSLYSSHVLPNRPAGTADQVDLKRSSYKKLQALIKYGHKKGWLVAKDVRGELVVTSGDRSHPDVETLRGYKTVAQAEAQLAKASASGGSSTGGESTAANGGGGGGGAGVVASAAAGSSGIVVHEYLKPSSSTIKHLLSLMPRPPSSTAGGGDGSNPRELYELHELKPLFVSYLASNGLVHPNSPKHFLLAPPPPPASLSLESIAHQELLVGALLRKGETLDGLEFGKERVMTKDEGFKRFTSNGGFSEYWGVGSTGERASEGGPSSSSSDVTRGKPPVIKIGIKNVGKRQVTLVSNHEGWSNVLGRDALGSEQLMEELKHKSASSCSIQPLAGSAKKHQVPKVEIMCQGTHDKLVVSLLVSKGVPKRYIEVDLSKSKK
ncbi:hypothetical protein JCM11491_004220 [Sporobolomyces phaffii]